MPSYEKTPAEQNEHEAQMRRQRALEQAEDYRRERVSRPSFLERLEQIFSESPI